MAINKITPPPREQKRDPFESILLGLKIANEGFSIPVNLEKFQAIRADRQKAERQERGEFTPVELAEKNLVALPGAPAAPSVALKPPSSGGGIEAPPSDAGIQVPEQKSRFPGLQGFDVSVIGKDGEKSPQKFISRDTLQGIEKKEEDLRKEWQSNPITQSTGKTAQAVAKLQEVAKNPGKFGATDIAGLVGFFKVIDEGSTVREGEFNTAQEAGGVMQSIKNFASNLQSGTRLTPEVRQDFIRASNLLLNAQLRAQSKVDEKFKNISQASGVNPDFVLTDFRSIVPETNISAGAAAPAEKQGPPPQPDFDKMTDDELDAQLRQRGIDPATGKPLNGN